MERSHDYLAFALPLTALTDFLALPVTAAAIDGGASVDQGKTDGLATRAEIPVPPPANARPRPLRSGRSCASAIGRPTARRRCGR